MTFQSVVNLATYRHAVSRAPELLAEVCSRIAGTARLEDEAGVGAPIDYQRAPIRISPLDQLNATYAWLFGEAAYWTRFDVRPLRSMEHTVRRIAGSGEVVGPRGIHAASDGGVVHAWGSALSARILHNWGTVEAHLSRPQVWGVAVARQWAQRADEALLEPLSHYLRDERVEGERPRHCPFCGQVEVWARDGRAVCGACERVVESDRWVSVTEAARAVNVSPRSVRRWIASGHLATRGSQATLRRVRLSDTQTAHQLAAARELLGTAG